MKDEDNFSTEQVKMNDPIFAASFSRYDRRRFGCFALTISLIVALTVFSTFKLTLHPLTRTGDAFSLHLWISAVENILMDDPIINNITAETETAHSMLVVNNVVPLNVAIVREPCEAQPQDKTDVASDAKLIEANVVNDHVEKSGARDLAENESEKALSNVEFIDSTKCGMQDHQRSWRDVAKQGMMKNGSL